MLWMVRNWSSSGARSIVVVNGGFEEREDELKIETESRDLDRKKKDVEEDGSGGEAWLLIVCFLFYVDTFS